MVEDVIHSIVNHNLPPFVVAEMSGNHGGDLAKALKLVEVASDCGANALKLQTYKPETITVRGTDERFQLRDGLWAGNTLYELYQQAMTPWEWHAQISQKCKDLGMYCFSSPFDESAVDFLESTINPPLYKVASFELNHYPMLKRIAKTGKAVLASIGVAEVNEIREALSTLRNFGAGEIILLHCVSEYPANPKDFCLNQMQGITENFGVPYGLSDHSSGHLVAVAATALGARVIEKHLSLDRDQSSIDGAFSMLPDEFSKMVDAVRTTHQAIKGTKASSKSVFYKRSILVASPIAKGDVLTEENIRVARPGDGLCPSYWEKVLGKISTRNLPVGHPLCMDDVELN